MKLSLALAGASLLGRALAELPPIETKVCLDPATSTTRLTMPHDADEDLSRAPNSSTPTTVPSCKSLDAILVSLSE